MTIYEKLCAARNEVFKENDYIAEQLRMKVLTRLIYLAFTNKENPDELPKFFVISNIECSRTEYLEEILEGFGIEVESVELKKKENWFDYTFFVRIV